MAIVSPFYYEFVGAADVASAVAVDLTAQVLRHPAPEGGAFRFSVQNTGSVDATVYGKLHGSGDYSVLGTVEAGYVRVMPSTPGLTSIKVVGSGAVGVIAG